MKDYYKQQYAKKKDNVEDMDKFLEKHNLLKLNQEEKENKNRPIRASLVVQWLRICLPMQGTRVQALVWEDPTCCGATRPVSHNY